MVSEPDLRFLKLVQQLDEERRRREAAEREAKGLRSVLTRLKAQRTTDAVAKKEPRAEC